MIMSLKILSPVVDWNAAGVSHAADAEVGRIAAQKDQAEQYPEACRHLSLFHQLTPLA
jgi:hypothetical protein